MQVANNIENSSTAVSVSGSVVLLYKTWLLVHTVLCVYVYMSNVVIPELVN